MAHVQESQEKGPPVGSGGLRLPARIANRKQILSNDAAMVQPRMENSPDAAAQVSPFRFLDLPSEIRRMIYHLSFPYQEWYYLQPRGNQQPALTLTCRQIMAEATPLWAADNAFSLEVSLPKKVTASHRRDPDRRSLSNHSLRHATFTDIELRLAYEAFPFFFTLRLRVALRDTNGVKIRATFQSFWGDWDPASEHEEEALLNPLLDMLAPLLGDINARPGFTGLTPEDLKQIISSIRLLPRPVRS